MNKKALIFDLDGTILDTLDDLANAVNHALKAYSYPEWDRASIRRFVGNGIRNLVIRSTPNGESNPDFENIFKEFKNYYSLHTMDNTKPYAGMPELIAELKSEGYRTAIVSNKSDSGVQVLKDRFYPDIIDIAAGEKENVGKKPDPTSTLNCLEYLKAKKEEAVFIGDSEVDVQTAHNAGIECILVTWGFRDKPELMKTDCKYFADTADELYKIINSLK